ncbi:MAG: TIGR03960 family B12-binding radical SAM protein [Firmicutes bacterium]|nr:TIGR03960 family B12-binding radical SAM protein [Bacillota bacterium]
MKNYQQHFWEDILPRVQKATRYLGNELNAVAKDHTRATMKVALAFPDLYEIGMSHLGLKILYHMINENQQWLAERVFMPGDDLEEILLEEAFPLCSLETVTPLASFDVVGFTLQYELSYATIVHMLTLAGIPINVAKRGETDPLIAGGGPGAFNPEPLVDFFDFFLIGDAEEALPEALMLLEQNADLPRVQKLTLLANVDGVYVPSLYKEKMGDNNEYLGLVPITADVPPTVKRAVVTNLDQAYYPTEFVVPYGGIVHDRLVLELFRGCTRGCRFCQAGIIYRPLRERKLSTLTELARKMVRATGYEEMALSSLSTGDYSDIEQLVRELGTDLAEEGVSLSLPSLRLDSFSSGLAEQVQRVRKSGLTFAPEAGTQRLRDVINKNITEEDLLHAVRDAFAAGWTSVKLYFMLGLPTETDEDILGIASLARKVVSAYKQAGGRGKPRITASASVFVPKAHTPFQWVGQISEEEIVRRQSLLRQAFRNSGVQFQWHGAQTSLLEAAIARGGRELAPVIVRAAELGCKLDGWDEYFSYSLWQQAFDEHGLDIETCAQRQYDEEEFLPWDHLDAGVSKRYLLREYKCALRGDVTEDCRDSCLGCGMALLLKDEAQKGVCTSADMD